MHSIETLVSLSNQLKYVTKSNNVELLLLVSDSYEPIQQDVVDATLEALKSEGVEVTSTDIEIGLEIKILTTKELMESLPSIDVIRDLNDICENLHSANVLAYTDKPYDGIKDEIEELLEEAQSEIENIKDNLTSNMLTGFKCNIEEIEDHAEVEA